MYNARQLVIFKERIFRSKINEIASFTCLLFFGKSCTHILNIRKVYRDGAWHFFYFILLRKGEAHTTALTIKRLAISDQTNQYYSQNVAKHHKRLGFCCGDFRKYLQYYTCEIWRNDDALKCHFDSVQVSA